DASREHRQCSPPDQLHLSIGATANTWSSERRVDGDFVPTPEVMRHFRYDGQSLPLLWFNQSVFRNSMRNCWTNSSCRVWGITTRTSFTRATGFEAATLLENSASRVKQRS